MYSPHIHSSHPRLSPTKCFLLFLILKSVCWISGESCETAWAKWNCRLAAFSISASGGAFLLTCQVCQLLHTARTQPDHASTMQHYHCLSHSQRTTTSFLHCRGEESICSWPVLPVDSKVSRTDWRWCKEEEVMCWCLNYPMLSLAKQQVPGNLHVKARPKMFFVKAREVFTTVNCWVPSERSDFQENLLIRSQHKYLK